MLRAVVTVVAALLVAATSARADDPPGLALAKRVVDEVRGDAHKEKMRIVWPETVEATPPEGAEVVLIDGYISCAMTRIVWRDGKIDARSVSTSRTWFYNPKGEDYGAFEFDVDPAAFAKAWTATRYLAGARDERIEPEPKDHSRSSTSSSGSHEPHKWTRLRVGDAAEPAFFGDARGENSRNWEDVREWNGVRDESAWKCLEALLPKKDAFRTAAPAAWNNVVTDEIRRATNRLDLRYDGEHHLLLEVCLRVGGEIGDAGTLAAVESLDAALRARAIDEQDSKWTRETLGGEIGIARTKLGLVTAWDSKKAADVICAARHEMYWQEDLTKWVRRRFRTQDPTGYGAALGEELAAGGPKKREDVLARLDEVREFRAAGAATFVRGRLDDEDRDVRVEAARALLALDPKDAAAAALLVAAADDDTLRVEAPGLATERWRRLDAVNECVDRGLLTPSDVRERLVRTTSARLVRGFLDALRRTKEPPTDDETLAAWRHVLNSPDRGDVIEAVPVLLDLRDRDARTLIVAALVRCGQFPGWKPKLVADLRERVAKEMPEETPPK